jgi:hypothetical protein
MAKRKYKYKKKYRKNYLKKQKEKKRLEKKLAKKETPKFAYRYRYNIVIFKNKKINRYLKSFHNMETVKRYLERLREPVKDIEFEIQYENGRKVEYEIGVVEKHSKKTIKLYKSDELGRNMPVELDDENYKIIMLFPYKKEEKIYHQTLKKRLTIDEFFENYMTTSSLKMISKLNNKIIVQDDDKWDLFVLKNIEDTDRFLNFLESKLIKQNKKNYMLVRDVSTAQRSYLYKELVDRGYFLRMLYRYDVTRTRGK